MFHIYLLCDHLSSIERPVTHKSRPIGRVTTVAIILLFILTTINFGFNWVSTSSAFIAHGQSFRSKYLVILFSENSIFLGMNITGVLNTIIADLTMVGAIHLEHFAVFFIIVCRYGVAGLSGDRSGLLSYHRF